MNIVQLIQGSPQWLDYRRSMRNASESAAVLGESPWMTPYQLWLEKTGRSTTKATAAMQRGTDLEPAARAAYDAHTGNVMQPMVVKDGDYSASLDGMDLDGLIVEIKCPYKGQASTLWNDAVVGQVPPYYQLQIQHQLMVSGAAQCDFWVFDGTQGILLTVLPDVAIMERIRRGWEAFQVFLDTDTAPPLTEADTVVRDDQAWQAAAAAFAEAKRQADACDAALSTARDALVALARHPREQGAGVYVSRYWKAGNVDYKKIPSLSGLDLTSYRGKAREEVRVSVAQT
jgi:putative phage-type endonuclease